ncbi:hypothetical protein DFH09DRAFT_1414438 [Mycena vulgaris]|nr:hypothetical protein DFH09DRAFT_1414438 [Mycena vulgaris]
MPPTAPVHRSRARTPLHEIVRLPSPFAETMPFHEVLLERRPPHPSVVHCPPYAVYRISVLRLRSATYVFALPPAPVPRRPYSARHRACLPLQPFPLDNSVEVVLQRRSLGPCSNAGPSYMSIPPRWSPPFDPAHSWLRLASTVSRCRKRLCLAAVPGPTSTASPPAPTPTVPAEPAPPVTTAAPDMTTADTPAPPQPGATPAPPTAEPTPAPAAAPETPEPQNGLAEKFTGYEWKALAEFRKTVPESLAKAYTEKLDARTTPITLWGVQIDPANLVDARVSVVLMNFLRVRTLNVSAASEMLVETLRWRDEFKVDSALKEEFPADVFGKLGHIFGCDKEGRPVVYNVYGGNSDLDAVFDHDERIIHPLDVIIERPDIVIRRLVETRRRERAHRIGRASPD